MNNQNKLNELLKKAKQGDIIIDNEITGECYIYK